MRLCCVLPPTVLALLVIIHPTSAELQYHTSAPSSHRSARFISLSQHYYIPSARLLRAHKIAYDDETYDDGDANNNEEIKNEGNGEERGITTSGIETISNSLKSTVAIEQLKGWLAKGESTDDVFKLLTLDKAADGLLADPRLADWISYMKLFNQGKKAREKVSLIATLTAHYGDEALAKIVEAAKLVPTTAAMAKRVQTEQIEHWLVRGKSPDDVFVILKLDEAGVDLFTQPQVLTWAKYVDDFNKANTEKKVSLVDAFTSRFNDETLTSMLIAAEKVPTTKKLATQIQAAQTMRWLHAEEPKTPAQVFKLLKLDKEGLVLFQNPLFGAWMQYTDDFRRIHFGNKLTIISTLRRYYRDDVLAKMILAASKSQGTANIGARLYAELLRTWFINKFSPENVFKLLKLDKAGDTFFENPLFTVWLKYVKHVNDADPKQKINLLTTLTTVIRERDLAKAFIVGKNVPELKNIASKLQTAQLRSWLSARKDPVEVFYLLRAIEGGEGAALYKTYISAFKAASSKRKTTNTKT